MKRGIVLLVIFIFIILLGSSVDASGCFVIERSACNNQGGKIIMGLSSPSNAHGELRDLNPPTGEYNYETVLCCDYKLDNGNLYGTSCSGGDTILRLFENTNAHAQIPENNDYATEICYQGFSSCVSRETNCLIGEVPVLSLTENTNAHIGGPYDYNTKICCMPNKIGTTTCEIDSDCPSEEICEDGVCTETCELKSAYWSSTDAVEGTDVDLIVAGINCEGEIIKYAIWEKDQMWDDEVLPIKTGTFDRDTWTSIWERDEITEGWGNPEYYFWASLSSNPNEMVRSSIDNSLLLKVTCLPGTWVYTDNYQCNSITGVRERQQRRLKCIHKSDYEYRWVTYACEFVTGMVCVGDGECCSPGVWTDTGNYQCNGFGEREKEQIHTICPSGTDTRWIDDLCASGLRCVEEGECVNDCILTNVEWKNPFSGLSIGTAVEGDIVKMFVTGVNCDSGDEIIFDIYEDDGLLGSTYIETWNGFFNSKSWTAKWESDWGVNPEYYYVATLADYEGMTLTGSNLLTVTPQCGNGVIQGIEVCDDNNQMNYDGCSYSACDVEFGWICEEEPSECYADCGDGYVVPFEEGCDDNDAKGGDGCSAVCEVEPGWECPVPGQPCNPICGNGEIQGNEVCDDEELNGEYGYCKADCTGIGEHCGDGLFSLGNEVCDDGIHNGEYGYCDEDCSGYLPLITNAYWSQTIAVEGDVVNMIVEGIHCEDQSIYFDISENDGATKQYLTTVYEGTCSDKNTWTTQWVADWSGPPEFMFEAIVTDYADDVRIWGSNELTVTPYCGNGVIQGNEVCDDEELNGEYGYCKADCTGIGEHCGDGLFSLGNEVCDDGIHNGEYGYCNEDCSGYIPDLTNAYWTDSSGNKITSTVEGNVVNLVANGIYCESHSIDFDIYEGGSSSQGWQATVEGTCTEKGVWTAKWIQDNYNILAGNYNPEYYFEAVMQEYDLSIDSGLLSVSPKCGNGNINGDEVCDDCNQESGDGCSSTCKIQESGWDCTDEPTDCSVSEPNACNPVCGDGILITPQEGCDDGNLDVEEDGCTVTCTVNEGWICPTPGQPCEEYCGDTLIVGEEECDDGNTAINDGCDSECMLETEAFWANRYGKKIGNNPIGIGANVGSTLKLIFNNTGTDYSGSTTFEIYEYDPGKSEKIRTISGGNALEGIFSSEGYGSVTVEWKITQEDYDAADELFFTDYDEFEFRIGDGQSNYLTIFPEDYTTWCSNYAEEPICNRCDDYNCYAAENSVNKKIFESFPDIWGSTRCGDFMMMGECEYQMNCMCNWKDGVCGYGWDLIHDCEGYPFIGECFYNEDIDDSCDDGFLEYAWLTSWTWANTNGYINPSYGPIGSEIEDYVEIGGLYYYDPIRLSEKCLGGSNILVCPAEIKIPFFWGW